MKKYFKERSTSNSKVHINKYGIRLNIEYRIWAVHNFKYAAFPFNSILL